MQALPDPLGSVKPWRDTWHGVRRALRHLNTPEDIIRWYAKVARIDLEWLVGLLDRPTNYVVKVLSQLKTLLNLHADDLPLSSRYYIDLVNLSGYPLQEDRVMSDDPYKWLSSPVLSEYSSVWWQDRFAQTYADNVRGAVGPVSFSTFITSRWMWVTPGATRFSVALLDSEPVKTKFGAALSLSDQELLRLTLNPSPGVESDIGVFVKPDEMGYKRRLIANLPLGAYITAAYVRYLLELSVGSTPSFMNLSPSPVEALDVIKLLRLGHLAMPLDESAYDYHVSQESWSGFCSFLSSTFRGNPGVQRFSDIVHNTNWVFGDESGRWLAGMPSGLALTSYVNSWMNYIKQKHIVPGALQWAAGDDTLVFPSVPKTLEDVAAEYARFGSDVNAAKNWLSRTRAEYLKVLYHRRGTTGYPARVYASLIWAGTERYFLPTDKLPELAELWKQFYDRLGLPLDENVVAADLSRAVAKKVSGFSTRVAKEWLHSPRALGGFGLIPYNDFSFSWDATVLRKLVYTNVRIRVPDVMFYGPDVKLVRGREKIRTGVTFHLGPPLSLPAVTDLSEWEKRLNREDNPIAGKYGSMALGIIPLPTINGVSTRVVSFFANSLGFNVLPNLRGSGSSVNSRLVLASLALYRYILAFMRMNALSELT